MGKNREEKVDKVMHKEEKSNTTDRVSLRALGVSQFPGATVTKYCKAGDLKW